MNPVQYRPEGRKEGHIDQFCSEIKSVFMVRKDTLERLENVACLTCVRLWALSPTLHKSGVMVNTCDPSSGKVNQENQDEIKVYPLLQSEFQACLGHRRLKQTRWNEGKKKKVYTVS